MSNETAHAVGEVPEWEELDMMVDSGASVTVINEEMVKAVTATDARPNVKYEVADGSLICYAYNNLGETCSGECGKLHVCQLCESPDHPYTRCPKYVKGANKS